MTRDPEDQGAQPAELVDGVRAVTCAQCTHVNAPGRGTCKKCGAHLFVRCNDCGARNPRVQPMCLECGRTLHRTRFSKLRSRFEKSGRYHKKVLIWLAAAAFLIVVGYLLIIEISNLSFKPVR